MELGTFVLCCSLFSSIVAFTLPHEETQFNNNNSLLAAEYGSNCVTGNCENSDCICCTGYVRETVSPWFYPRYDCVADCKTNPCKNGGKCTVKSKHVLCVCKETFTGDRCEKSMKEICSDFNCGDHGICFVSSDGNPECMCDIGYKGANCETEICSDFNCGDHGKCFVNSDGNPECKCNSGYKGTNCETDICEGRNCYNGGTCYDEGDNAVCICINGFMGSNCEIFSEICWDVSCGDHGKCFVNSDGNPECKCDSGYKGTNCETDICEGRNCYNGGTCYDEGDNAVCICINGFRGSNCEIFPTERCKDEISKCAETGGTCISEDSETFHCNCTKGKKYDQNYGCVDTCLNMECIHGKCFIDNGKPKCDCYMGYMGVKCEIAITEVSPLDDSDDGLLLNLYINKSTSLAIGSKFDFQFGFKQTANQTLAHILMRLKMNSAVRPFQENCSNLTCQNDGNCIIQNDVAVCNCSEKYTGDNCEKDKCSLVNCQNGGSCEIKNGKPTCFCTDAFRGDFCEVYKCSLIKCHNGGHCDVRNGKAECSCNDKYTGDYCEIDKCSMIKCHNGGKCDIKKGKAVCACNNKYTGAFCEFDKCSLIRCLNGGRCEISHQKAGCVCSEEFTGVFCEESIYSLTKKKNNSEN